MSGSNMASQAILHTIAICTSNRLDVLSRTIERLRSTLLYFESTELVIVNNGPAADTARIRDFAAGRFLGTGLRLRVVHEERPGLSYARNRALDIAQGALVTILDDDASPVDRQWQRSLRDLFAARPEVAVCGGPSILVPPAGAQERPYWRSDNTDRLMSCLEKGSTGPVPPETIYGVNATYRSSAIRDIRFHAQLGWNHSRKYPVAGEETLFHQQICAQGWTAWFEQDAAVYHFMDPDRYKPRWILRRAFISGRTFAMFELMNNDRISWLKVLSATGRIGLSLIRTAVRAMQGRRTSAFAHACRLQAERGYVWLMLERSMNRNALALPADTQKPSSPIQTTRIGKEG